MVARLLVRAPEGGERDVALTGAVLTIGKTPDNGLVLVDTAASRKHAQIERRGQGYLLQDLSSLNGTFLNGKRMGAEAQQLKDGDEILIGRTRIRFRLLPDMSQFATVENEALREKEPPPRRTVIIDSPSGQ